MIFWPRPVRRLSLRSSLLQADVWKIPSGDYYYMSIGNAARPSWASSVAVTQGASAGPTTTTMCFSRLLASSSAAVSASLTSTSTIGMVYAAANSGVTDIGAPHKYQV